MEAEIIPIPKHCLDKNCYSILQRAHEMMAGEDGISKLYDNCVNKNETACNTLIHKRAPELQSAIRAASAKILGATRPCRFRGDDGDR